tara:strand:+ start:1651 stop:2538 length:888 start_codon:yes stop_codon:yes gene_type:complete
MSLIGDVNGDRVITMQDAKDIADYIVGKRDSINIPNADLDSDSQITIRDAARIADHVAGIQLLDTPFRIRTIFTDPTNFLNEDDKRVINQAIAKWNGIITNAVYNNYLYDIVVYVDIVTRDANILASAGPYVPSSSINGKFIPYAGVLELNTSNWRFQMSDVKANGETTAYRTVVHELAHIFGIGTLWWENRLLDSYGWYIGENALREYRNYFNDQSFVAIPVENDGGPGTAGGHLEEGTQVGASINDRTRDGKFYPGLNRDLLTGWAERDDGPEPLTKISIGLLEDCGYKVKYE